MSIIPIGKIQSYSAGQIGRPVVGCVWWDYSTCDAVSPIFLGGGGANIPDNRNSQFVRGSSQTDTGTIVATSNPVPAEGTTQLPAVITKNDDDGSAAEELYGLELAFIGLGLLVVLAVLLPGKGSGK